jgi:type IV secretory pathway VirB2 component (pilin)
MKTCAAPLRTAACVVLVGLIAAMPALAQTADPFLGGAEALVDNIFLWLTPIAVILIAVLGGMAMANQISWAWCISAILGIAIAFGAENVVDWIKGMFGV